MLLHGPPLHYPVSCVDACVYEDFICSVAGVRMREFRDRAHAAE